MKNVLPILFLIFCSWGFFYACKPEKVAPTDPLVALPPLDAVPEKTTLKPYEIFKITVKHRLNAPAYAAKFGTVDITLKTVNDTLLVGGVPDVTPGDFQLKGDIEGAGLDLNFKIGAAPSITSPKTYLEDFVRISDLSSYKASLDSLVDKGTMTQSQADAEFNQVKSNQDAFMQKIAEASPEDQRIAAAFLAANRAHLDEIQTALGKLRVAQNMHNGRMQFVDAEVKFRLNEIKIAIGKIGAMIAGPAIIAGSVAVYVPGQVAAFNYWASAGAALGAAIFRNAIREQRDIIVTASMDIFDNAIVPVANSIRENIKLRTTAQKTFIQGLAYEPNISIKLRNLQPSDANSEVFSISSFVSIYGTFRQLWQEYMPDLGGIPDLLPLIEKEVEVDYSKVTVKITDNPKVSGGLVKEGEVYKFKFTTEEQTDQEFTFTYTYALPDMLPFEQEVQALLTVPVYTVTIVKGNNQKGAPDEVLKDSLVIKVTDEANKPVEGFGVSWNVVSGGGSLTAGAATNKQGFSMVKWTLGAREEENKVEAVVKNKSGKEIPNGKVTFLANAQNAYALKYVLGNNQTGALGEILPEELIVRVVDHNQMPVKDQKVWWAVLEGGGLITESTITDENGESKAKWRLGSSGVQKAQAFYKDKDGHEVPGSPVVFTATNLAYSLKIVSGNNQTGNPGENLAESLVVKAEDAQGKGVKDVPLTWSALSGSVTGASLTDANGLAEASWRLGTGPGPYQAQVTSDKATNKTVAFLATESTLQVAYTSGQPVPEKISVVSGTTINLMLQGGNGQSAGTIDYSQVNLSSQYVYGVEVLLARQGSGFSLTFKSSHNIDRDIDFDVFYKGKKLQTIKATIQTTSKLGGWYVGKYQLNHWGSDPASNAVYNCGDQHGQQGNVYFYVKPIGGDQAKVIMYTQSILEGIPDLYLNAYIDPQDFSVNSFGFRRMRLLWQENMGPDPNNSNDNLYRTFELDWANVRDGLSIESNSGGSAMYRVPTGTGSNECDQRYNFFYKVTWSAEYAGLNVPAGISEQALSKINQVLAGQMGDVIKE